MADYSRQDVEDLRGDIAKLESSIRQLTGAMKMYAPRHEVDEAIRAKVSQLGVDVGQAIADAQHAANAALTASLNADDAATEAKGSARDAQTHVRRLRRREWSRIWGSLGLGSVVWALLMDRHIHLHQGLADSPLTPAPGGYPVTPLVAVIVFALSLILLAASAKDRTKGDDR